MQTISSLGMFFFYMKTATGLGWYDFVGTYSIGPWVPAGSSPEAIPTFGQDPDGNLLTAEDFQWQLQIGQCVTFVTLVILQWGNIMSVRNRRLSILQGDPIRPRRRNLWLFLGMLASLVTAIIVTEVPWFQQVMQTGPVPIRHWFLPLPLALGIIVMDDVRKLIVRVFPNSIVAKIAW
jgi:sodium/potassium-transporting ATPase subunit alpha